MQILHKYLFRMQSNKKNFNYQIFSTKFCISTYKTRKKPIFIPFRTILSVFLHILYRFYEIYAHLIKGILSEKSYKAQTFDWRGPISISF